MDIDHDWIIGTYFIDGVNVLIRTYTEKGVKYGRFVARADDAETAHRIAVALNTTVLVANA